VLPHASSHSSRTLANGRIDLLTVVSHEIGHLLGLDHDASGDQPLMGEAMDAGTRFLIVAEQPSLDADQLFGNQGKDTLDGGPEKKSKKRK
jgi:hypothetical protein